MMRRLLSSLSVCVAAVASLVLLPAAPASAASSKVLLVTRSETGNGPPAATGEAAHITNFVKWEALGTICGVTDEGAKVGKNPSGTVKVGGSGSALEMGCFNLGKGEPAGGSVTIKSLSVSKTGAVTMHARVEVETGGCHYFATKLTGTQTFGENEQLVDELTGTAKLIKKGSLLSCAPTTLVNDQAAAADTAGYNYVVELT